MSISNINTIAYFDTVTGVVDDGTNFHTVPGSLDFAVATNCVKDITRFNNEAFTFYIRMEDVTNTSFQVLLGGNNAWTGKAVRFDFSASNKWIRLADVNLADGALVTVLTEKDIHERFIFTNSVYIKVEIIISNDVVKVKYNNAPVLEYGAFSLIGNNWGFSNQTASAQVRVSDLYHYQDQIFWGNVNINGAPNAAGEVWLYNQSTYKVVDNQYCNAAGEYLIFLEDDPANLNKYFMYGYVPGSGNSQPRGVCNITL